MEKGGWIELERMRCKKDRARYNGAVWMSRIAGFLRNAVRAKAPPARNFLRALTYTRARHLRISITSCPELMCGCQRKSTHPVTKVALTTGRGGRCYRTAEKLRLFKTLRSYPKRFRATIQSIIFLFSFIRKLFLYSHRISFCNKIKLTRIS